MQKETSLVDGPHIPGKKSAAASPERSWLLVTSSVFGVFGLLFIFLDMPLVALADGTGLRGDARRVLDLAEAFSFGPSAVVIALGVVLADRRSKWFTARLFAYPILAGLLANLMKLPIPRLRPRGLAELTSLQSIAPTGWETFSFFSPLSDLSQVGDGSSSAWQSFPSGHTATAVGLAIGLSRLYPQARWYFAALAVMAGLQRVYSNSHYPSDVLMGAAVAMLCCWVLERKSFLSLAITRGGGEGAVGEELKVSRAA